MRKFLLTLILMLVVGGGLGLLMKQDAGYVLLSFNGITVETSMWIFVAFISLGYYAIHWAIKLLWVVLHPNSSLSKVTSGIAQKRAAQNTIKGMLELVGGNWDKAEKLLTNSADKVSYPLINYIGAAYAASEQDENDRSKELLREAHKVAPDAEFAIGFAQSQIQLRQGHYEGALATLLHLHKLKPKHRQTLKMLVTVYTKLKDWDALQKLTPTLKKYGIFKEENLRDLERNAFLALLEQLKFRRKVGKDTQNLVEDLQVLWAKLDSIQQDDSMQLIYTSNLIEFGGETQAESYLRNLLAKSMNDTLVLIYGSLDCTANTKTLNHVESWVKKSPDNAALLLTAGRICQKQKLWGKAKDYYERAITIDYRSDAVDELSRLLEALGDQAASHQLLLDRVQANPKALIKLPLP